MNLPLKIIAQACWRHILHTINGLYVEFQAADRVDGKLSS